MDLWGPGLAAVTSLRTVTADVEGMRIAIPDSSREGGGSWGCCFDQLTSGDPWLPGTELREAGDLVSRVAPRFSPSGRLCRAS